MASSKPSFPAPSEPNLKRLGVSRGGGDRPIRAQLVVAGVALLIIVALPLYILRKPSVDAETGGPDPMGSVAPRALIRSALDAGAPEVQVRLSQTERVKCSAAPNRQGNEGNLCDRLIVLEEALSRAIQSTAGCAPKTGKEGSINFVLTVDFVQKRLNIFPGASGQWKGPQAKAATKCVTAAMPEVQWDSLPHRYRYYMMAIMAHYPAPDPLDVVPEFE
jgi:hypothetical protein